MCGNASRLLVRLQGIQIVGQGQVRHVLNKTFAERRDRNPERDIPVLQLRGEVRLLQDAPGRRIRASGDGKQIVNAAIGSAVRISDKAGLQYWAVGRQERRDRIGCAIQIGNSNLRIRSRAAAPDRRLRMAQKTTVAVESRSKSRQRLSAERAFD